MALPINKVRPEMRWKIYYHDPDRRDKFFTYSNLDGSAAGAPDFGIVCIVQPIWGGRERTYVAGGDWYAIDEEGKWVTFNDSGLQDRKDNNIPYSHLKQGRWINDERYAEILTRAHGDADFGGNGKYRKVEE